MPLATGVRVGAYEVVGLIGIGGMGEVYRARDRKLQREVAIKILPEPFALDPERRARFEREAQVLASLNHPHIAAVYGFEDAGVTHAIVMELVEGPTLADRAGRGPVPLVEALAMARQIAAALDAAHEKGIVHRDLKPANIKLMPDGTVKLLDFGLAKALSGDAGPASLTHSPTLSVGGTAAGVILGTAAYMSPEQARGQSVDKRADIWAFGCVLYELLTGRRAFGGETVSDVVASILTRDPDWTALPLDTPGSVRALMRRCLEKDTRKRLRDIGDALFDMERATDPVQDDRAAPRRFWTGRRVASGAVASIAAIATTAWLLPARTATLPPPIRTTIVLPPDQRLILQNMAGAYPLVVSPDGRHIVYAAERDGRTSLYVRSLDRLDARMIPGSIGGHQPFFSPDGEWVGFFARGALHKAALAGGMPLRICELRENSVGGTWARDGTIVFAQMRLGLFKVPAGGGAVERLTTIAGEQSDGGHAYPDMLPDGEHAIFVIGGHSLATVSVRTGRVKVAARRTDVTGDGAPSLGDGYIKQVRWASTGHLLYGQALTAWALPFDPTSLAVTGAPVAVAEDIYEGPGGAGPVYFAASGSGTFAYMPDSSRFQIVWVDRVGRGTPAADGWHAYRLPRVSPDGSRIAVTIDADPNPSDIWVYHASTGSRTRLTTEGHNLSPVWSPDSRRIAFYNAAGIHVRRADGTRHDDVTLKRVGAPQSWSPDGSELLFHETTSNKRAGIWALQPGSGAAREVVDGPFNEFDPRLSPDGRLMAYVSDESGSPEVYVARYPTLQERVAVSRSGGQAPVWAPDGRELFFLQGDAMMAATVDATAMRIGVPRELFSGPFGGTSGSPQFDVAPDGRFLMIRNEDALAGRQLVVVQGWFQELSRKSSARQ